MKTWDVIVIGGGVIGLSLAWELRKQGASVLVVERGEPGHEASRAAGGMLANCADETPAALQPLANASAEMYPEFVHQLQDESDVNVDLRSDGTLLFVPPGNYTPDIHVATPLSTPLADIEPALARETGPAFLLQERSVCPRALTEATLKAAKHRGADVSSGSRVLSVNVVDGHVTGVTTEKTSYYASRVVNCAGAWAGMVGPCPFPTRPVKGQMVCFAMPSRELLKHVVRSPEIYLIPRSDGRLLAGATVEEAGFDKRTIPDTIQQLRRAAISRLPALSTAHVLEDWAGLRPGTPDGLPILGSTSIPGYFVATGHFRDGILLAPITARIMAQVIGGIRAEHDLAPFSVERFALRAA
ncbi:MAG: glycine oxidase ThiO [Acidobacteria bacterium]|nr:MAG: glycine oxidase ThiO [Acidobacteriota bacterium]